MDRKWMVGAGVLVSAIAVIMAFRGQGAASGSGDAWETFGADNVSYSIPAGWTKADPFTTATPYWSHLWFHDYPPRTARVALLQSPPSDQFQIMLWLGGRADLEERVKKHLGDYDSHPLVKRVEQQRVVTTDGVTVSVRVARMLPGALAGEDVTYVLGHADLGDTMFVLNAGSLTRGYDERSWQDVIRSLRLRK
jgi:hypothetical protein